MRIVVSTHQGVLYNEEVDYVVVHSDTDGEYAVLKDHVPVVSVMDTGYVKLVKGKDEFYVVIQSGIFEFNNNEAVVLVQEAIIGRTAEAAKENLEKIRKERLEKNRQESTDFTQMEKELHENIKKSGAGQL
ncbi:F-type H+-transporting ATPase subunit epsilon [Anaeroplasma bactoclasticum]|jgi:F-type H+-transporting ATPase subunit epsilon|uniref:F-type H+-transporting ATPase subunit epsilon n=1 Tax=Anaeroplasma bactoclasticum TaxID=2088 RepID=A0A397S1I2_9MOLU|nr:F0F1 ATP synthase subunit epsilon [Anaeroplasma bactoclasticum]RIA77817.1 F-type H+-transporting ATPase subunit epsilon [Anaeroplasma bactoclasticum]